MASKIEAGNDVVQDSLYLSGQIELTKNVELKMNECREYFQMMSAFIEKAFRTEKRSGLNLESMIMRKHV